MSVTPTKAMVLAAGLGLGPVTLAADIQGFNSAEQQLHAGGEAKIGPVALRAGLTAPLANTGANATKDTGADLAAGVGLDLDSLRFDYAYLMPCDLPETHRLSLAIRF